MPILLYCVAKRAILGTQPILGIGGAPVNRETFGPLEAFLSRSDDSAVWLRAELRTSALEFHRVLDQLFQSAAIIPFRFPTIFADQQELESHLKQRLNEYDVLLDEFSNLVQMEIRITADAPVSADSGTDYLKQRQQAITAAEQFAETLKRVLESFIPQWRQRTIRNGLRVFALVVRRDVAQFQNTLSGIPIPSELQARASGPWPVSEFIEQG
jgi:hypothetical protein